MGTGNQGRAFGDVERRDAWGREIGDAGTWGRENGDAVRYAWGRGLYSRKAGESSYTWIYIDRKS